MLAIFKTGGKQYSVKAGQILKVEKLSGKKGDDISFRYYGVLSGYLFSVESQDENNNLTTSNYSDFREVDGITFPFEFEIQGQKILIEEIIVNEDLKDSSF